MVSMDPAHSLLPLALLHREGSGSLPKDRAWGSCFVDSFMSLPF